MTIATSPYLNMTCRTRAEVLAEKREDLRQEEMGRGSAVTEECDELEHLADLGEQYFQKLVAAQYHSEAVDFLIAILRDGIADLLVTARDKREEERNNR